MEDALPMAPPVPTLGPTLPTDEGRDGRPPRGSWTRLTTECVHLNRTCCAAVGALLLLLVTLANLCLELVNGSAKPSAPPNGSDPDTVLLVQLGKTLMRRVWTQVMAAAAAADSTPPPVPEDHHE